MHRRKARCDVLGYKAQVQAITSRRPTLAGSELQQFQNRHRATKLTTMKTAVLFLVLSAVVLSCSHPSPKEDDRGGVDVDVHKEKGVGTVVGVHGQGNVWKSDDGKTRVDADGSWQRVYHGPGAGKPNYSGGVRVSHTWG